MATILDWFSWQLLGYAMSKHHDADLVAASLGIAATTGVAISMGSSSIGIEAGITMSRPMPPCRRLGVVQSTRRLGSALCNADAEAFNSLSRSSTSTTTGSAPEARHAEDRTWIGDFYDPRRRQRRAKPSKGRHDD